MFHCKKCDGLGFRTISALRAHQWKEHADSFNNLMTAASRLKASRTRKRRQKSLVKLEVLTNGNGQMSAAQLLSQLQEQQKFINDVVGLIGGMIAQHEANK